MIKKILWYWDLLAEFVKILERVHEFTNEANTFSIGINSMNSWDTLLEWDDLIHYKKKLMFQDVEHITRQRSIQMAAIATPFIASDIDFVAQMCRDDDDLME